MPTVARLITPALTLLALAGPAPAQSPAITALSLPVGVGRTDNGELRLLAPEAAIKSPSKAVLISTGGTALGIGAGMLLLDFATGDDGSGFLEQQAGNAGGLLLVGGVVAGPALGYMYAGEFRQARGGIILRAVASVVTGVVVLVLAIEDFTDIFEPGESGNAGTIKAVASVGGALVAGSIVLDVARLPGVVRRHNAAVAERALGTARWESSTRGATFQAPVAVVYPTYSLRHRAPGIAGAAWF